MRLKLLLGLLTLSACGTHIPKNVPCLINEPGNDLICSDGKENFHITLKQADKYVCWSQHDVRKIFEYIRRLESEK